MDQITQVATAFVQHYYQVFDTNREGLHGLYVCTPFPAEISYKAARFHAYVPG